MNSNLKAHIEYQLCINIEQVNSISGGDISKAYLISTATERFFCKTFISEYALQLYHTEKAGLGAIAKTKTIATPKVLLCDSFEKGAFLVLEYIEPKNFSSEDMTLLGHQIAALHELSSSDTFGWEADNFIGKLPQSNKVHSDWTTFYVEERLLPQLKIALDTQLLSTSEIPVESKIFDNCKNMFPNIKPCLLHGDLWSGNYLISAQDIPYLIDPAVYYGHHEVDIAMTKLFGGFSSNFYDAYGQHFPTIGGEKERCEIYQLYYLLVHLNLFGASYKKSVTATLKKYF